jgi:hypothetical protein
VDGDSTSRASTKRWHAPCNPCSIEDSQQDAIPRRCPVCSWSESNCLSRSALRPVFAPPGTRWQSRKMRGPAFLMSRVNPRAPKPAHETRGFPPRMQFGQCRILLGGAPTACGRSPPPSQIQATEPTPTARPWALPTPAWGLSAPRPPTGFSSSAVQGSGAFDAPPGGSECNRDLSSTIRDGTYHMGRRQSPL